MASAAVVALVATGCQPKATEGWRSELVSVVTGGTGSSSGLVSEILVSPDGTKVVFVSNTNDLVSLPDMNFESDVYLRDLATGTTTLVSANAAGTAAANGVSSDIALSADGTRVAFVSTATDLGPAATPPGQPGQPDRPENVYVKDLITGAVDLVSVAATGTATGDWPSFDPVFDPSDSSRVVFTSRAQNLLPEPDIESQDDIFLRDVDAGTTTLLTPTIHDVNVGDGPSGHVSFAADGSALVFESGAYLVEGMFGDGDDVYRRDMATGAITLVSYDIAGTGAMGNSEEPVLSPDGTMVAYTHSGYDGLPDDPDPERDIHVRDLVTGTTALASGATDYHADLPVFSPDGTHLTFIGGLVSLERTGTGLTVTHDDRLPYRIPGRAEPSAFTPDGQRLLFTSRVPFDPRDTNSGDDLYLLDLATGAYELVSANATATGAGNYDSARFVPSGISADGSVIAFISEATDLTGHQPAGQFPGRNVYVARYDDAFDRTDLVVTGSAAPAVVAVGGQITYQVTVANEGPAAAENVSLQLQKPGGVQPTSLTASSGRCDGLPAEFADRVTCRLGTLAPGASVQVTLVGTVLDWPADPDRTAGAVADLGPTVDPDTDDNWVTMPATIG